MSSPTNPIIGKDCVLAYDEITAWAAPSWNDITRAQDVSMPGITKNAVSLPARAAGGWDLKGAGLKALDLQFGYLYHAGTDAVLAALRDSFLNDTVLMFAVLDGLSAGIVGRDVQGFRFAGIVFDFPIDEAMEEGRTLDIKVEAAYYDDAGTLRKPEWYTIDDLTP